MEEGEGKKEERSAGKRGEGGKLNDIKLPRQLKFERFLCGL